MKKALFLLLALALMLMVAACQPPHLVDSPSADTKPSEKPAPGSGDIQLTVEEQTVSGDAESVTLTVTNASDKEYTYGAMASIEAEKDGTWEEVKPVSDLMWIAIAYVISPGQSNEETVTLKGNYGTLAPGNYRIVKEFTDPQGGSLTAYAAFTVE